MRKRVFMFITLFFLLISFGLSNDVKLNGFFQGWFSYGEISPDYGDVYGFTLKRVRLKATGDFGSQFKWVIQAGWDKQSPALIDAYLYISLKKEFNIKFGKFTIPGAKSSTLSSTPKLDFIERAMFIQKWGYNMTLAGYRTTGIQVDGKLFNSKLYYAFMVGNNSTSRLFTPSVKSSGYSPLKSDILFAGRFEIFPISGISTGGFYSRTTNVGSVTKSYSYGFHFFYVKNKLNFKTEYLSGKFFLNFNDNTIDDEYNGMMFKLGYRMNKIEPIIRYDFYTPKKGSYDSKFVKKYNNFTLGLNYLYSKHIKVQVNYVIRNENMEEGHMELKNNLFYIHLQYSF